MKKVITIILAAAMAAMMSFSFGCGARISTVTLNVRLYTAATTYDTYQIELSLYEHLAPDTAVEFKKWAKEGVYDGMAFYLMDTYASQVMVGDLKWEGAELKLVQPADLCRGRSSPRTARRDPISKTSPVRSVCGENSIGNPAISRTASKRPFSTIYMPTTTISAYNGYFCVLGKYSDDEDSVTAMNAIKDALNGDEAETYVRFQFKNDETVRLMTEEEYDAISSDRVDEDSVVKITVPAFMCYIESVEC